MKEKLRMCLGVVAGVALSVACVATLGILAIGFSHLFALIASLP